MASSSSGSMPILMGQRCLKKWLPGALAQASRLCKKIIFQTITHDPAWEPQIPRAAPAAPPYKDKAAGSGHLLQAVTSALSLKIITPGQGRKLPSVFFSRNNWTYHRQRSYYLLRNHYVKKSRRLAYASPKHFHRRPQS
jgi:hypothetical protein